MNESTPPPAPAPNPTPAPPPPPAPPKNIYEFFSSPLGLLLAGFLLTGLLGAFVSSWFAGATWKKDKRFELFKANIAKHEALLTDVTTIVGARTFRAQRIVWVADAPDSPTSEVWKLDDEHTKNVETFWDDYYKTVIDWNLNYRNYAAKIRLLAGDKVADEFFAPGASGARLSKSDTLCGSFEESHKLVSELRKEARTGTVDRRKHDDAQRNIDALYDKVDAFVHDLYRVLGDKEKSEDPLETESRHDTN